MDFVTLLGFVAGFGGILVGQMLEGGDLGALVQFTAAFIVIGGTLGATLVSTTREDLRTALRLLRMAFTSDSHDRAHRVAAEIVEAAQLARKESILALEQRVDRFDDAFMQNVFRFVVDGVEPSALYEIFETEIEVEEERLIAGAKVWTDAGGFSPTIGIIGAVLGLIHVMNNITDTSKLGSGIAVAFVATVYGVGLANLVLLPIGNKLKRRARESLGLRRMVLEGGVAIASGLHPFVVREKMRVHLGIDPKEAGKPPRGFTNKPPDEKASA